MVLTENGCSLQLQPTCTLLKPTDVKSVKNRGRTCMYSATSIISRPHLSRTLIILTCLRALVHEYGGYGLRPFRGDNS